MNTKQRFACIWDATEDTPQESANLRVRSALMMSIAEAINAQALTQAQAAELFGVTQPLISDLVRGKLNLFSLDALVDMASTAGMNPTIRVTVPKKVGTKASKTTQDSRPTVRKGKAVSVSAA